MTGDREHLHHRLLDLGLSPRQAAVVLYAVSGAFALASMLFLNPNVREVAVVLTIIGIGMWLAVRYLRLHEFSELARLARRGLTQTRAISFNVEIRRAAVEMEGCRRWPDLAAALARLFEASEFDSVVLRVTPAAGGVPWSARLENGEVSPESPARPVDEWELLLPFEVGPTGGGRGELDLRRRYGRNALLTDVNLLVETLRPALTRAAARIGPPIPGQPL